MKVTQALTEQGVLSPNGSSRTFDAVQDGNPIRAVIRSTASNFDGKTPGIAKSSADSQETLIRACYEAAELHNLNKFIR